MHEVQAVHFSRMESPVGPLLLAATDEGLRYLLFDRGKQPPPRPHEVWIESPAALRDYEDQLRGYFRGELRSFTCKLDLQGTSFQKKCWAALQRIPYGTTCTYAELAKRVGSPRAFRAVGQANHNNPVAIIVPCHRVIGANGSLTGYGGGMGRRRKIVTPDVPVAFRSSFGNVVVARALESNGKNCGGRNSEEEDQEKGSPSEGIVSSANRQ